MQKKQPFPLPQGTVTFFQQDFAGFHIKIYSELCFNGEKKKLTIFVTKIEQM